MGLVAENTRLRAALDEIANITERKKSFFPVDWRDQIAACPECLRYKGHPIQNGICDEHRRPIYAQEEHDRHETKVLGYRAQAIARAALATPAPDAVQEAARVPEIAALIEAVSALGAMPEGYCFCSENRVGDESKQHEPECRDLRAAIKSFGW